MNLEFKAIAMCKYTLPPFLLLQLSGADLLVIVYDCTSTESFSKV